VSESRLSLWGLDVVPSLVLIALAMIAIIWFLWALPTWLRRSTFRPGQPWSGEPLWVGAPADSAGAPAAIEPARASAIGGAGSSAGADDDGRGGASARW